MSREFFYSTDCLAKERSIDYLGGNSNSTWIYKRAIVIRAYLLVEQCASNWSIFIPTIVFEIILKYIFGLNML
jgi:hypothetical protein